MSKNILLYNIEKTIEVLKRTQSDSVRKMAITKLAQFGFTYNQIEKLLKSIS